MNRTAWVVVACSTLAALGGYAAGGLGRDAPSAAREQADELGREESSLDDGAALTECEARLASSEAALAQRPTSFEGPPIDVGALPEEARVALDSPEASRAIEVEVERRISERFERERTRREAQWAERRAETRERLRAIGIDDATLTQVTPAMCAMREVYRQAWSAGRGGAGDAGVRMGRRELRESTRELREEVTSTIGEARMGRLEEEGGLRALGGAVECEGEATGAR